MSGVIRKHVFPRIWIYTDFFEFLSLQGVMEASTFWNLSKNSVVFVHIFLIFD